MYQHTSEYYVHSRPLGEKYAGSHFYKNVSWSDIAVQNVPCETTRALREADEYNDHRRKCAILNSMFKRDGEETMINDKKIDNAIRESGATHTPIKGELFDPELLLVVVFTFIPGFYC